MNGHELVFKLNQLSGKELDLPVYSEGCDCTEPARNLVVEDGFYDEDANPVIRAIVVKR